MDMKKTTNLEFEVTREVNTMKKFLKIMLIIIGAISLIFVALIGIGLFVDVEYDDHIENGRYTYVPEEENKDNEYVEFYKKTLLKSSVLKFGVISVAAVQTGAALTAYRGIPVLP